MSIELAGVKIGYLKHTRTKSILSPSFTFDNHEISNFLADDQVPVEVFEAGIAEMLGIRDVIPASTLSADRASYTGETLYPRRLAVS